MPKVAYKEASNKIKDFDLNIKLFDLKSSNWNHFLCSQMPSLGDEYVKYLMSLENNFSQLKRWNIESSISTTTIKRTWKLLSVNEFNEKFLSATKREELRKEHKELSVQLSVHNLNRVNNIDDSFLYSFSYIEQYLPCIRLVLPEVNTTQTPLIKKEAPEFFTDFNYASLNQLHQRMLEYLSTNELPKDILLTKFKPSFTFVQLMVTLDDNKAWLLRKGIPGAIIKRISSLLRKMLDSWVSNPPDSLLLEISKVLAFFKAIQTPREKRTALEVKLDLKLKEEFDQKIDNYHYGDDNG